MATRQGQGKDAPGPEDRKPIGPPTLVFAGFARLPSNAGSAGGGSVLAVELEVDPYDMRVVDAACACLPSLGQKFLISLIVGKRLDDGLEDAMLEIRLRYFSVAQRAMIAALQDVLKQYEEYRRTQRTA